VHGYFVTIIPQLLDILIVGKRMGDIERALDGAAIRIPPVLCEQNLGEELPIIVVDGIVEGQQDHLRNTLGRNTTRYLGAILGAETLRQLALPGITSTRRIRIMLHIAPTFVGTVGTVHRSVAEVLLRQAGATSMIGGGRSTYGSITLSRRQKQRLTLVEKI